MSQHPSLEGHSFPDRNVIILLDRIIWYERECGGEKPPYFGIEKSEREKQREKEGYYIISTFFSPPLMF